MPTQISAYSKRTFAAATQKGHKIKHDVYERGVGKVVVIIQELPGIGQETLALADQFVNRGYKVVLPHLFGPIGKISMKANLIRVFCMRREFRVFAKSKSSPIVDWLGALCIQVKEENLVSGVAVIGMCLTGNFAISLMANDAVLASYASQPSLPLQDQNATHLSKDEIDIIKARIDEVGPIHCKRFEGDKICAAQRFELLEAQFNDGKQRIITETLPGDGHSILTLDFVDEAGHPTRRALDDIMEYFDRQLS